MNEPTLPDGHQPAEPPRFPEQTSGEYLGGGDDATPPHQPRPASDDAPTAPAAEATVAFGGPAAVQPPPPGAQPPPPGAQPPSYGGPAGGPPPPAAGPQYGAPQFGGPNPAATPPPAGPGPQYGGPQYGGAPPGGPGPQFGAPTGGDDGGKKRSGALIGGLIAVLVLLLGGVGFVLLRGGGDDGEAVTTTTEAEATTTTTTSTLPVVIETTVPPTTTEPAADGSVDGLFVHVEPSTELIADADLDATLQRIGLAEGDNPVATDETVRNLCAAIPVPSPVDANVIWTRDNVTISEGDVRRFASPADGNCINNNGDPLDAGSYEVSFEDAAGGLSTVALFTVGVPEVSQDLLNDTGVELCSVEVGPVLSGFYQSFELTTGEPLAIGDSIVLTIADLDHEARGVNCDGEPLDSVTFTPSTDPISLTSGAAAPATTIPPPEITAEEIDALIGEVGALSTAVGPGSPEETAALTLLLTSPTRLPITTTDVALTLCAAWNVPGPLTADMVWEFNRVEIARFPMSTVDGAIGRCVPPGGPQFDEGAYQVYLQRGDVRSGVETFTVGRAETQLAFRNDTGVAVCEVGFSPTLTNFYTFLRFADSTDFAGELVPGDAFTIVAPFIENDIQARDCDGNVVAENFNIPPTDQTLNLSTGQP